MYHANFEAVLRYGNIFYGSSGEIYRVFTCHKRALRVMLKMNLRESCRGKFKSLSMLTVIGIYLQEALLFFFKNKNLFECYKPKNIYPTRSLDYNYPMHRLSVFEKGPLYKCIKFYNELPTSIKQLTTLKTFKKAVHKLLLELEPYEIGDYLHD